MTSFCHLSLKTKKTQENEKEKCLKEVGRNEDALQVVPKIKN